MSENSQKSVAKQQSNGNQWASIWANVQEIAKDKNTYIGLGTGVCLTLVGIKIYQVVTSDNKKK